MIKSHRRKERSGSKVVVLAAVGVALLLLIPLPFGSYLLSLRSIYFSTMSASASRTALTALCRRTSASASAVSRRQFGNTSLAKGGASPPLPPFARNPGEFFLVEEGIYLLNRNICGGILAATLSNATCGFSCVCPLSGDSERAS